jgi:hypothetical protein
MIPTLQLDEPSTKSSYSTLDALSMHFSTNLSNFDHVYRKRGAASQLSSELCWFL